MRLWIEYLMQYQPAQEDFLSWVEKSKQNIIKQMVIEAKSGDSVKITPLALELGIYTKIGETLAAEFREKQSQLKE